MTINPNLYKYTLDQLKDTVVVGAKEHPDYNTLTLLSLGSHIPFAAVVAYALRPDVHGESLGLRELLDATIAFYQYEGVLTWDDLPITPLF